MADRFPNVSFDWLGNLPAVAQAAQDRTTLRETLADLKSTDPDSLERKAAQLISSGNLQAGLQLQQAALARRTLTQKGASDALQAQYLQNFAYPRMGGGQAPAEQAPNISLTPGGPAPAGPDLFQGRPGAIPGVGPQSALPPSPSDAIIAAAQQGTAPQQAPPTQLAGPPPAPGPAAPQGPAWLQGAQAPAVPAQQAAPAAPAGPLKMPAYQANAQAEADAVGQALSGMPRQLMNSGPGRALMERFRDAMSKLRLTPEQQSWQEERISRAREGKPDISFSEYQTQVKTAPERIKEVGKLYVEQEKKSAQSQDLISTLNRMEQITKDPNFISGSSATAYAEGVNKLSSIAKTIGIDPEEIKGRLGSIIQPHLKAAALVQEFTALSNAALMAHIGSFSKSFSDADRAFVEKIFPQIIQTPGGISKIIANLKDIAEHAKGSTRAVRQYMQDKDLKVTEHGFYEAINDYGDKNPLFINPDGSLTSRGKQMEAAASDKSQQGGPPITKFGPDDEGKTGRDFEGNRYIIKGGKAVPYT
jgi:hypothetical protein